MVSISHNDFRVAARRETAFHALLQSVRSGVESDSFLVPHARLAYSRAIAEATFINS